MWIDFYTYLLDKILYFSYFCINFENLKKSNLTIEKLIKYLDYINVEDILKCTVNNKGKIKVIKQKHSIPICLIVDGKINPVASLICTILLEIGSMERLSIKERMPSGRTQYIEKCRREGIKMGRPATYRKSDDKMKEQYKKDISLLRQGLSLRQINAITGTSIMTIRKLYKFVHN